jgi:hypothetical protein
MVQSQKPQFSVTDMKVGKTATGRLYWEQEQDAGSRNIDEQCKKINQ